MQKTYTAALPDRRMNYPDAILVYYTSKGTDKAGKQIYRYEGPSNGLWMQEDSEILFFKELWYE